MRRRRSGSRLVAIGEGLVAAALALAPAAAAAAAVALSPTTAADDDEMTLAHHSLEARGWMAPHRIHILKP
jgi:hypothetical protein